MKKIIYSAMAVAMLATTSCKDDFAESFVGEEATVEFSISTPEIGTRYGEGETVNNLHYAVYDNGTLLTELTKNDVTFNGSAKLQLQLKTGKTYDLVFWADNANAPYVVDFSGKKMTIDYTSSVSCNNEQLDAFYKHEKITVEGNRTLDVKLTRPFAQLNIAASDFEEAEKANYIPNASSITVYGAANTLNFLSGAITGNVDVTFASTAIPTDDLTVNNITYDYLAMTYVLPADNKTVMDIEFTIAGNTHSETRTVGSVPFQSNYRTNIYGNILTSQQEVNITIDPAFGGEENKQVVSVSTASQLQDAIDNATPGQTTEIILDDNIELTQTLIFRASPINPAPSQTRSEEATTANSFVLNLNGKSINASYEENSTTKHIYAIENYSDLTIKNGTINARGNFNYGRLTIEEGVTIKAIDGNGGYGVRNYGGAEFVMNGGTIATTLEDDNKVNEGGYDATTLRVDEGATATINGGTINNICDYTFAIENYGETIVNGGTFISIHSTVSNYGTMTINDGSFTCNGIEGITAHALVAWDGSTTTIEGGTFDGKDNYNGFNVDAAEGAIVYIKDGEFLPVHSGSLYGEGTIEVSGGTFYDEISESRLAEGYIVEEYGNLYKVVKAPDPVAKVGNASYATIDDAIANWTNNTTLTLLSDVTLSNVVTLKSTEHHILDLGTYTMTAASGKHAIEVTCNGLTNATYALTINADATNPGGITATGKSCIYYKKSDTTKDRPIIRIYNGVFTGSYSINSTSNGNTNCPQIWIYGGVFNSYMNLTKNMLRVFGGTFHAAINCTGDSSAYREISGGRFKSWQFMTADADSKFWVGTAKATYDVGVYVDDEGYLVVGGDPITEFGDRFEAKATNYSKWSSYLKYSSAAANGLYYTNAEMAITKHGEANVVLK